MSHENRPIVLACDVDDTLVPVDTRDIVDRLQGAISLGRLCDLIKSERSSRKQPVYFGTATGRSLASHKEREQQVPAFQAAAKIMDFTITSVGSAISLATPEGQKTVEGWPQTSNWHRDFIAQTLLQRPELTLQGPEGQGTYKVSFDVFGVSDDFHGQYVDTVAAHLAEENVPAQVLFSGGRFLDILPAGVNKGTALTRTVGALAVEHGDTVPMLTIAADDSMNGLDLLEAADRVILPGNAHDSLREWAIATIEPSCLYLAKGNFAAGVMEGYQYFTKQ